MKQYHFAVVGGDRRQAALADALAGDGHRVEAWALEQGGLSGAVEQRDDLAGLARCRCVILPLPVGGEAGRLNGPLCPAPPTLEEVFDHLRPEQFLCGGRVDSETYTLAKNRGLRLLDYFQREELTVANAVPTAEGAVQIALAETGATLHRARVLVLGYGRVGQLTAHRMAALGARVTVAARRYDALAWAEAYGHDAVGLSEIGEYLCGFDVVVNTIPALVLPRENLTQLKPECLVIDLASKPGGVDFQAAEALGVRCIWALALPGKVAPVSAGLAIRNTIYNMLREDS